MVGHALQGPLKQQKKKAIYRVQAHTNMNKFQVNQCTNEQLEMIDPLENFAASKNLKYRIFFDRISD